MWDTIYIEITQFYRYKNYIKEGYLSKFKDRKSFPALIQNSGKALLSDTRERDFSAAPERENIGINTAGREKQMARRMRHIQRSLIWNMAIPVLSISVQFARHRASRRVPNMLR
jgi:hypothetical protein